MITDLRIDEQRKKQYYEKGYWTEETLNDVWTEQAKKFADSEYISDSFGLRLTYGEVDDKAARLASWLVENGIKPGDVVSFQIPIWSEFCIVYVAVLKAGAVLHPLAKNFNDEDLEYCMNLVESKAFICPTFYHKTDYEQQIIETRDKIPSLGPILLVDKLTPANSDLPTLSSILETYEPLAEMPAVSSDEVAVILSTSGTTGTPKQVLLTHNNILFSERSFVKGAERTQKDVMIMQSPLNHATGFFHGLISPMLLGGRTVLQDHFVVCEAVELSNKEGATWTMGATPFIYDLLEYIDETGHKPTTLDLFLSGGAPVPGSLVSKAHAYGITLCELYGSTESCPHIYVPPSKAIEWNGAWSGIAYEGIEVRVVDENHVEVPRGVQGEECSRGPHQFVGYLKNEEANRKSLDDEGWFYSGDLCHMDEEGRIRINGRKKEIIIRGGENISANEIDEHIMDCPGVGDHATIGMPDPRLGERICTFIVPEGDIRPTVKSLQECLLKLDVAKRLWPERVELIDEIPHTLTGKVKRHELAAELAKRMADEQTPTS